MRSEEKKSLAGIRLEHANDCLAEAEILYGAGVYKGAANRAYYAIFHAMRAVLALDGFDSQKHSGIIAQFRKDYLKTGIISKELSPMIDGLVEIRQGSDYDDFYVVSKSEVEEQLANARVFVSRIEEYPNNIN